MKIFFAVIIAFLVAGSVFFFINQKKLDQIQIKTPLGNYQNQKSESSYNQPQSLFLTIDSPKNGEIVSFSSIKVSGKVTAGSDVFVNDTETKADANGNFSVQINLDEGENIINVIANDKDGNYKEEELTVTFEAP